MEWLKVFMICWSISFTTENKQLVTYKEFTSLKWLQSVSKEKEINCFQKPSKHICLILVRWEVTTLKKWSFPHHYFYMRSFVFYRVEQYLGWMRSGVHMFAQQRAGCCQCPEPCRHKSSCKAFGLIYGSTKTCLTWQSPLGCPSTARRPSCKERVTGYYRQNVRPGLCRRCTAWLCSTEQQDQPATIVCRWGIRLWC